MSDWPRSMEIRPLLQWPGEQTEQRRASAFSAGLTATLQLLDAELTHLGATETPILEVAIPPEQFRLDGRPRSQAKAEHPGVILSVVGTVGAMRYPCDTFTGWQHNLRAIALSLEALRRVDRYGVTKTGEQYAGFLAIEARPQRGGKTTEQARAFLFEVAQGPFPGITDVELIRKAKRAAHPDTGGSPDLFQQVLAAERILKGQAA